MVNVPVVSNEQCRKVYEPASGPKLPNGITEDLICAGEEQDEKDACQVTNLI